MQNTIIFLCLLVLLATSCHECVEFVEIASIPLVGAYNTTAENNTKVTLERIKEIAVAAKRNDVSIVIFPEAILWWFFSREEALASTLVSEFTLVSNGTTSNGEKLNPCKTQPNTILGAVSCLSSEVGITLVVNLATRTNALLYNTAIASGPTGIVLASYRKMHVYGSSPQFDAPSSGDLSFFRTSNGNTLGLLVCVDLEFMEPLNALLKVVPDLTALVIPASWSNTPPLSFSVLYPQGLSRAIEAKTGRNVTVLFANCGQNSACWGAGAYKSGFSIGKEASAAPSEGEYHGVIKVPLHSTSISFSDTNENLYKLSLKPSKKTELEAVVENIDCIIPFYGTGKCSRMIGDAGRVSARTTGITDSMGNGNSVLCEAVFSTPTLKHINNTSGIPVLVAMDVQFGGYETPTPLHLIACSVFMCKDTNTNMVGNDYDNGSYSGKALNCMEGYNDIGYSDMYIQMMHSHDDKDKWQVLPLVGTSSGHTMEGDRWVWQQQDQLTHLSMSTIHISGDDLGTATILGIEQNQ